MYRPLMVKTNRLINMKKYYRSLFSERLSQLFKITSSAAETVVQLGWKMMRKE